MKKLIVGLLAAFLMTTGLVAFTSTQASAACPYSGCLGTRVFADITKANKQVTINASVKAVGSSRQPKGSIVIKVQKKGFFWSETVGAGGGSVTTPKLKKGKYTVTVRFIKKRDSAFFSSTAIQRTVKIG